LRCTRGSACKWSRELEFGLEIFRETGRRFVDAIGVEAVLSYGGWHRIGEETTWELGGLSGT
jgi:hypothetical protein